MTPHHLKIILNIMMPPLPKPPGSKSLVCNEEPVMQKPRMDRDETSFILRRCLAPRHYTDPNVLNFIREYLNCRNIKQAANSIGLKKRDGDNLMKRPDINEAVRQITEAACFKVGYDPTEIIYRVKEIADVDPADFQRPDGSYIESLHEVPAETRRAIKSFKCMNVYGVDPNGMRIVTGKMINIEFNDKLKANELLGRNNSLFRESKKITHDLTSNMSSVLLESKRRAEAAVAEFREVNPTITIEELRKLKDDEE